jgi:hypothetical protein
MVVSRPTEHIHTQRMRTPGKRLLRSRTSDDLMRSFIYHNVMYDNVIYHELHLDFVAIEIERACRLSR